MGQFKSKSLLLTGCLMAVSFSIINCQKAPNRSGTKANVTAPGAETADKADKADKADAKQVAKDQCTPEAKGAVEVMRTLREGKSIETSSTKDKNEAEKNAIITDRVKYLDNCITLTKELEKLTEKACLYNKDAKITNDTEKNKNNISLNKVSKSCTSVKEKLKSEDNQEHTYAAPVVAPTSIKDGASGSGGSGGTGATGAAALADQKKIAEDFKKANLVMSDELKEMTAMNRTEFQQGLINGEIVTDSSKLLEAANSKDKKVVCSFGESTQLIDKAVSKSVIVTIQSYSAATRKATDSKTSFDTRLVEAFTGDATSMVLSRVKDYSEQGMLDGSGETTAIVANLVCLNIKSDAANIADIKKALGKHIKIISDADLKKLQDENKKKLEKAKADALAANVKPTTPAAPAPAAVPVVATPAPAPVAVVLNDKQKATAEIAKVKSDISAQTARLTAIKVDLAAAKTASETFQETNKAILATLDGAIIREEMKKINAEGAKAQGEIDAAKVKNDQAALTAATLALRVAQDKVKALGEKYKGIDLAKVRDAYEARDAALLKLETLTKSSTAELEKLNAMTAALDKAKAAGKAAQLTDAEIEAAGATPVVITAAAAAPAAAAK